MKQIILKLEKSLFDKGGKRYSGRKISALVVMFLVIILHIKWFRSNKWEYAAEILFLDYTFILVCLGLVAWQTIAENKNKNSKNDIESGE